MAQRFHSRQARSEAPLAGRASELAAGARDLAVIARKLADGLFQGKHATGRRGESAEFYDYRAYAPGDPIGRIDWRVFGRTDRHYVRRFTHESQLTVMIALDASASMGFASVTGEGETKLRRAKEIAAGLCYLTVRQGDRMGLVAARGTGEPVVIQPGGTWARAREILVGLDGLQADGEGGLAQAVRASADVRTGRCLEVILGDGLEDPGALEEELHRARKGAATVSFARRAGGTGREIVMIQILADDELDISGVGAGRFVDPETGLAVHSFGKEAASEYARVMREHIAAIRCVVLRAGGRHILARTSEDPAIALRRLLTGPE